MSAPSNLPWGNSSSQPQPAFGRFRVRLGRASSTSTTIRPAPYEEESSTTTKRRRIATEDNDDGDDSTIIARTDRDSESQDTSHDQQDASHLVECSCGALLFFLPDNETLSGRFDIDEEGHEVISVQEFNIAHPSCGESSIVVELDMSKGELRVLRVDNGEDLPWEADAEASQNPDGEGSSQGVRNGENDIIVFHLQGL